MALVARDFPLHCDRPGSQKEDDATTTKRHRPATATQHGQQRGGSHVHEQRPGGNGMVDFTLEPPAHGPKEAEASK
jgi:hypothetical protein